MKQFGICLCLIFSGVVAGWFLRDLADERHLFLAQKPAALPDLPEAAGNPIKHSTVTGHDSVIAPSLPQPTMPPEYDSFAELLESREYRSAITYYENAIQIDDREQTLLKAQLVDYLRSHIQGCADVHFIEVVQLWLQAYYADIDVLLMLAENQSFCGSPGEAARTLQIAHTYALNPAERAGVAAGVARLIAATDKQFTLQQNWIELLGFYEFLEASDLATKSSQLSRASLYARIGEIQRSQDLLMELRDSDHGMNIEWTAALNQQLANIAERPLPDTGPQHEIALTRRGNHYNVSATINGGNPLALVIDTGASITTLSRESFSKMDTGQARYLGTQLFNTANGVTQGEIYQVESIRLGAIDIPNPKIAVLDFEASAGLDGLLGMNVLQRYRFEIDQDKNILYLSPRQ